MQQIDEFQTKEGLSGIKECSETKAKHELGLLTAEERTKSLAIDYLKEEKFDIMRQVAKKEWIKTSFWMPENNHTIGNMPPPVRPTGPPIQRLNCPIGGTELHSMKVKDIVTLRMN